MAWEQPLERVGEFAADIDMSNGTVWNYAPVWLGQAVNIAGNDNGKAALQAKGSNTNPAFGILQNAPVQGEPGTVITEGISKCLVATAITAIGGPIKLVAGGCAPATTTGDFIDGYALETGPVGSVIAVKLKTMGKV